MKTLLHITTRADGVAPVESGKRATKFGYDKIYIPYSKRGIWKKFKNVYTGIFFDDGTHMTWNFNPPNPDFPIGVKEKDSATVRIIGKYEDKDVACLVVEWKGNKYQP